ncbi:platelet glycoprotein VI-like [Monodelphis domestica]|uniref:platelet glycoprotein VI-like n=1 Tax=Monodelphis domestica TaxID=13616 RepID=UPI0024E24AA0|nr:platelet glycoprotein VI-like [Monodelphis domestica]
MASTLYAQAWSFPNKAFYGERFGYFPGTFKHLGASLVHLGSPQYLISTKIPDHCQGTLIRPTLSAVPSPLVYYGGNVTLKCQGQVGSDRFQLWKDGELIEDRNVSHSLEWFLLKNVDEMNFKRSYSCRYRLGTSWSLTYSCILDVFPKASLSVWPGPEVASGTNVTLLCKGPSWSTKFLLHKEGDEEILHSTDIIQDGAQFFFPHVTTKHSGIYTCSYQPSTNGSLWTQHSDPVELTVRGPRSILMIMTLSFVSIFPLCIALLAFLYRSSIPMGASAALVFPRQSPHLSPLRPPERKPHMQK